MRKQDCNICIILYSLISKISLLNSTLKWAWCLDQYSSTVIWRAISMGHCRRQYIYYFIYCCYL